MNNNNINRPLDEQPSQVVAATSNNQRASRGPAANTDSQQQRSTPSRARFIKSKSSPSSLTTHKFGLRPTPSPPRLIIDHQTGDIVERYPENPILLRTYQPIDDANTTHEDISDDELQSVDDDDTTQNQIDDSEFATNSLRNNQPQPPPPPSSHTASGRMADFNQHTNTSSRPNLHHQHHNHAHHPGRPHPIGGQMIPPPHSGKVYFAPPVTSNNLFDAPLMNQNSQPSSSSALPPLTAAIQPNASFKRALNQISDTERTDIAILTEPDDAYEPGAAPQMKITATSASKASALLAKQQPRPQVISTNASKLYGQPAHSRSPSLHRSSPVGSGSGASGDKWKAMAQQHQQQRQRLKRQQTLAAIEDFDLYNFCYNFRILMVVLVSALIVYLLVWPLANDCAQFRPTYAYVSIITACVNLIFVLVFTLFWYCTSVSRTLYQNLSSSAFIVTIYSILVCVNLTLGIIFFFINTCHFQKLLATHSALADVAHPIGQHRHRQAGRTLLIDSSDESAELEAGRQSDPAAYSDLRRQQLVLSEIIETIERELSESDKSRLELEGASESRAGEHSNDLIDVATGRSRRQIDQGDQVDDATVIDDQLNQQQPTTTQAAARTTTATTTTTESDFFNQDHASGYAEVPEVSPLEAAWRWVKEQAHQFKRQFYKFLVNYDLKFIGALHAICAACFQYLAIKVAVVRSFYCSPFELEA